MDEPNQNPETNPGSLESTMPPEGDQRSQISESIRSQSVIDTTASEFAPAVPESIASVPAKPSSSFIERYWRIALIAILVLAIAFCIRGLNWDESQHLHPDERFLTMVESAIKLPSSLGQYFDTAQSPLNPYNNNFGSFVYGTAPLFLVRLLSQLIGMTDYGKVYLLGRILSALADVFVVVMTFAIGRRLYGLRIGLLAAR